MADDFSIRLSNLERSMVTVLETVNKSLASRLMVKQANLVLEERLNAVEAALVSLAARVALLEAA